MVAPVVPSFPKSGSDYTVTYTGGPLDKKRETRNQSAIFLPRLPLARNQPMGNTCSQKNPATDAI